jgi:ribose transport system ATP-binding protein
MTGVVEISSVTKTFPGVRALDDVSISLAAGEIHALIGENGAGKSTLIKIITGVYLPDRGEMRLDDAPVVFRSPHEAIGAGIGAVHQERNLVPRFTVAENICLDRLPTRRGLIDNKSIVADAVRWLKTMGLALDPRQPVRELSVAQMQLVEIAKALSLRSRVLLLDEPTASITPHEADLLFDILRDLKARGVAVLFVSHRLEEVLSLCDRVTVLRDGRNTAVSQPFAGMGRSDLVRLMIGRDEDVGSARDALAAQGAPVLELKGLSTAAGHRNLDLRLHAGEILGLYGLIGCGRSELAKAIIGIIPVTGGEINVAGQPARIGSVAEALSKYKIGYVSEDRKGEGVVLDHSITTNIGVTVWPRLARGVFRYLSRARETKTVRPFAEKLQIRAPSLSVLVGKLSGGNQQKVSVAKWLVAGTEILILDEPTVGIDVRTKAALHALIRELADRGTAILLISSDMPEIVAVADRIEVMNAFGIVGQLENSHRYAEMSGRIMDAIHGAADRPQMVEPSRGPEAGPANELPGRMMS